MHGTPRARRWCSAALDRDYSRASYALLIAGAVSFAIALFWQRRRVRETSGFDQGGDGGGASADWRHSEHHDGFDGEHDAGGGDGGH
jgi:hypothetical protein